MSLEQLCWLSMWLGWGWRARALAFSLHPLLASCCYGEPPASSSLHSAPQVDQRVFRDLMSEKLPRLHAHFEQHKVDYTLITFNWFLVVFVDSVVSDVLFKIWDSFLYEGPKVSVLVLSPCQPCEWGQRWWQRSPWCLSHLIARCHWRWA